MIKPGEEIIGGSNQRFRVLDVVLFEDRTSRRASGCYRSRRPYLSSARVVDLLVAVPKMGPVKAARLLKTARVSESKTL
jgi:hypothetical protein